MKRIMMIIVALSALSWMAGDAAAQYRAWGRPRGYVAYPYSPYGVYYRPYRSYYPGYRYSYYPGYSSYYYYPAPTYYYPGAYYYPGYSYYPGYGYPGYVRPGITLRFGW